MQQQITREDKRLLRRQAALERSGMSAEHFDAAFTHLQGGHYLERTAILTACERIRMTALSAEGSPVVGGIAAAIMHGSRWYEKDFVVELVRHPSGSGRRGRGSRVHRTDLEPPDIITIDDIAVTSPVRTAFDLGRIRPDWRALGHLDDLARATGFSLDELAAYADGRDGRRGIRQLRGLIPLIDGKAESPPESWVRLVIIRADLPAPETQIEVADENEYVFARLDLGYRVPKIGIEFDGEDFHSSPAQRAHDEARDARLRELGWIIIRIDAERLRTRPWSVINEIERALRSRGAYF